VEALRLLARRGVDVAYDADSALRRVGPRLDRLAETFPRREVLVLGVYREPVDLLAACAELIASRHSVRLWLGAMSAAAPRLAAQTRTSGMTGGKLENINALWADWRRQQLPVPDWTLVIDDDVRLPRHFLDRFLALCERFDLTLAQPAQSRRSHAAWPVTRRQPRSLVRETRFVEVGPLTAFRKEAVAGLLPMPPLRYGWGLDQHWAAVAELEQWRIGVVDATPVRHERQAIANTYSQSEACAERERFLAGRSHLTRSEANVTLQVHRRLPTQRRFGEFTR
jgi:hypothetical protein